MTDIKILYDKIYSDGIQKPPKVFIDIYEENKNLIESADTSTSNPDYDGIMRITSEYGMALSSYGSSKKSLPFRAMEIHKRRKPIEQIAKEMRPIINGIINYYGKFSVGHMRYIWNQLNARLLKWVKWEKGLYKFAAVKWLQDKYRKSPVLFPHWKLVHP